MNVEFTSIYFFVHFEFFYCLRIFRLFLKGNAPRFLTNRNPTKQFRGKISSHGSGCLYAHTLVEISTVHPLLLILRRKPTKSVYRIANHIATTAVTPIDPIDLRKKVLSFPMDVFVNRRTINTEK